MGDPDQPHSYSYTPDVAAALITLATQPGATGSVWHLPISETRTTRHIIDRLYQLAGHRPKSFAAGATTLRLFGLIRPPMREYLNTLYQFTDPWIVDDTMYRTAFGNPTTPLDDALAVTLQWYRHAASTTPDPAATRIQDGAPPRGPHPEEPSPIEPEGTSR
jgi:nucleoside-diphosphate-sugar epimerase